MPRAINEIHELYNQWRRELDQRRALEAQQLQQQAQAQQGPAEEQPPLYRQMAYADYIGMQNPPEPVAQERPPIPDHLRGLDNVMFNGREWIQVARMAQGHPAVVNPDVPNAPIPGPRVNIRGGAVPQPRVREARVAVDPALYQWAVRDRPRGREREEPKEEPMPKQPEAKPLNIDKYLDTVQNRIYRVGIELEGGWVNPPAGVNVIRDGSVKDLQAPLGQLIQASGEIPSFAMEPVKVRPWMKKYYPQVVNHTCGLHVHMSFMSALHYEWLIAPEYQETVLEYLQRFGEREGIPKNNSFWKRVGGNHEHCIKLYWPDHQIAVDRKHFDGDHGRGRPGNRYTAINYCWGQHNTLECRVLPMFKEPEMGVKAVIEVLRITNACLVALARKEKPLKADFFVEDDAIYQDHRKEIV